MFLQESEDDLMRILFSLPISANDTIMVAAANTTFFPHLSVANLFQRPHNYGEVFMDLYHYNENGYSAIGRKLYELLLENNYLNTINTNTNTNTNSPILSPFVDFRFSPIIAQKSYSDQPLQQFVTEISQYKKLIGGIVMNCNPFTLGHRYLIQTAAKQCLHLYIFVVEEDKSMFTFADRLELVKQGTVDLQNVTVLPSGKFIISSLTFSDYFNKSELQDREIDPSKDVELFARDIAPALGINIRFAGEEPLDKVTKQYNDTMRQILPQYGIEFVEIPRMEQGCSVISASRVRKYLETKNFDAIAKLVPETTFKYLHSKY